MIYIGYAFTAEPVINLSKRGFAFHLNPKIQGCKDQLVIFNDFKGFSIREVVDEGEYFKLNSVKNFNPVVISNNPEGIFIEHSNTASQILKHLTEQNLESGDLKSYLAIRKRFEIWALHLGCIDFRKFVEVAKPDRIFSLNNNDAALIHLGPNCFDLVVTSI